ncbi:MAG: hypothetical protein IT445_14015 [Phycisphaeraceae bacterium]|nr:hypothetical protein [Phycisphaeraceae bacterium]
MLYIAKHVWQAQHRETRGNILPFQITFSKGLFMRFDFYQISVVDGGADLFRDELTHSQRNEIAHEIILSRPEGVYRNQSYHLGNLTQQGDAIWGRIIRPGATQIGIMNEETGDVDDATVDSAFWTHFVYLIDEQVIAVVRNPEFFSGEPHGMSRLVESVINAGIAQQPYSLRVIPKSRTQTFWEVLARSRKVTYLRMEFVPPNVFRSRGQLADILRTLRTNNGAKKVGYDLSNAERGLEIQEADESIREEVTYIGQGGGRWQIRHQEADGTKKTARSDHATVTGQVDYQIGQITDTSIRTAILQWIRRFLEQLT